MHERPLFSILPQLYFFENTALEQTISTFWHSRFMDSIISFELDEDYVLPKLKADDELFFSQSPHLTHIRVTLHCFDDCIRLLNRLGSQLHSFAVSLVHTSILESNTVSQMTSVNICFPFDISINCFHLDILS